MTSAQAQQFRERLASGYYDLPTTLQLPARRLLPDLRPDLTDPS